MNLIFLTDNKHPCKVTEKLHSGRFVTWRQSNKVHASVCEIKAASSRAASPTGGRLGERGDLSQRFTLWLWVIQRGSNTLWDLMEVFPDPPVFLSVIFSSSVWSSSPEQNAAHPHSSSSFSHVSKHQLDLLVALQQLQLHLGNYCRAGRGRIRGMNSQECKVCVFVGCYWVAFYVTVTEIQ